MVGENSQDAGLSAKNEMERVMKSTLDHIHMEINERFFRLNEMDLKFGFLLNVEELCYGHITDVLLENCKNLGDLYSREFNGLELHDEILDCRMLLSIRLPEKIKKYPKSFCNSLSDLAMKVSFQIALHILLIIATSIASCERSFSKLKLILSYLRASMGQKRLCDITLLSIEKAVTKKTEL
ncbi:hypothetical protein AVEN_123080-1 [Araneus ventricosus]|uniref:HAT C-terminal dimerisation domain-containing protein n=1 Tax=Araneus ventricosus TaxID=182803 RepID=A0A4Y2RSE1_ARAVE|nr:hypothetical protein AVEN_123080-1 [Araneus ventricosus]